jgi:hypothetical protein
MDNITQRIKIFFRKRKIFSLKEAEDRFTEIYKINFWGSNESLSGTGSTLEYTQNIRKLIPDLVNKYQIKSIFDAPCGDFNWMNILLKRIDVQYLGADIVRELINSNKLKYKKDKVDFIYMDLINDNFPLSDLMICRDCLFHLSYQDIRSVLKNFVSSGIPYILTTTHVNTSAFLNKDIKTGDYRKIDLFSAPFSFDPKPLERIADWVYPDPEREMCLWSRQQIIKTLTV